MKEGRLRINEDKWGEGWCQGRTEKSTVWVELWGSKQNGKEYRWVMSRNKDGCMMKQ